MSALAFLKSTKLHGLPVLRLLVQTLATCLTGYELLSHARTRSIERICVGVHWRVEGVAGLHQVVEVLI